MPRRILTNDRRTRDMAHDAISAIVADNNPPEIFARVEDNLRITQYGARIQPMDKSLVTHLGEHCCDWLATRKNGDVPCKMPAHVADDMLAQAPWEDLPPLKRLVRSPVILSDDRILASSGYDHGSGLYLALEPGFVLPPVPDEPSEDDLQHAFGYLQGYLDEFVFASKADSANALGLFIGHLLRPMLGEEALLPMFCVDAPIQSTGKTALANATGMFALGGPPKIVPEITDANEWRKQVAALLAGEVELVLFDNLTQKLDDASLAAMLTGEGMWGGRLLGGNLLVNERTKLTVIVTGNNLEVGADLRRRVIYIRMDTNLADPSSRQFKRTDFLGSLKQARPRLLSALFTWARRWLQLGSPSAGAPILAGYNAFVRTVHGMLSMLGVDQWLGNLASFRTAQDPETLAWERWLAEWFRLWQSSPQPTGDLARALNSFQADYVAFSDSRPSELLTYGQVDREKLPTTLGFALQKHQDRIFGGLKLVRATVKDGYTRYRVIPVDQVEAPQEPSTPPAESVGVVGEVGEWEGVHSSPQKIAKKPSRAKIETTPTSPTTPTENTVPAGARRARVRETSCRGSRSFLAGARAARVNRVATDTETLGLRWWAGDKARVVTMATDTEVIWADLWADPEALADLQAALEESDSAYHNAAFDHGVLQEAGALGVNGWQFFDTMLASQLLDAGSGERQAQSLEALADRYLGVTLDKSYQAGPWDGPLTEEQIAYACQDAAVTYDLAEILRERIEQEGLTEALRIEQEFVPFMLALRRNGMPVDQDRWLGLEQHTIETRLRLEQNLKDLYAGEPPERWTQKGWLEQYLEDHGLVTERTRAGKPSASKAALEAVQHDPLIAAYAAWKPFEKRGSTWGTKFLRDNLEADGRFHGEYLQLGTRTGRLACTRPNLQQIPHGAYREALRPTEGRCLIKADYSQLQLVIIADETLDPVMLSAYDPNVPHDKRPDLHTITARSVLGLRIPEGEKVKGVHRVVAKGINFGLCYGMGATRLAAIIERETHQPCDLEVAKMQRFKYFQTYSGVAHWHGLAKHRSSRGQTHEDDLYPNPIDIRTASGRRRTAVVDFTQKVNSPIQMREADGVKSGLALLLPRLDQFNDARPVMMIHDEVLVECDRTEASEVARVVANSLEEGMNRWLKYTTATVTVEICQDYAGTEFEENAQ